MHRFTGTCTYVQYLPMVHTHYRKIDLSRYHRVTSLFVCIYVHMYDTRKVAYVPIISVLCQSFLSHPRAPPDLESYASPAWQSLKITLR